MVLFVVPNTYLINFRKELTFHINFITTETKIQFDQIFSLNCHVVMGKGVYVLLVVDSW